MTSLIPRVWTPRAMAERLGVPTHLVRSILEDIPDVLPRAFADSVPIYTEDAFARLRHELNLLEAKEAQRDE